MRPCTRQRPRAGIGWRPPRGGTIRFFSHRAGLPLYLHVLHRSCSVRKATGVQKTNRLVCPAQTSLQKPSNASPKRTGRLFFCPPVATFRGNFYDQPFRRLGMGGVNPPSIKRDAKSFDCLRGNRVDAGERTMVPSLAANCHSAATAKARTWALVYSPYGHPVWNEQWQLGTITPGAVLTTDWLGTS